MKKYLSSILANTAILALLYYAATTKHAGLSNVITLIAILLLTSIPGLFLLNKNDIKAHVNKGNLKMTKNQRKLSLAFDWLIVTVAAYFGYWFLCFVTMLFSIGTIHIYNMVDAVKKETTTN